MISDKNVAAVIVKLGEREARGMEKYGVTTDREDLTLLDWLQHLQEELLDGSVYIERVMRDLREPRGRA